MTVRFEVPAAGREAAVAFVAEHLDGLFGDDPVGSERFRGGQVAADAALAGYDVTAYAWRRNDVLPESRRGASALSPYIRHGLLTLREVWDHVAGGPSKDVSKFRDELLWQEFARHWYARLGNRTRRGIRRDAVATTDASTVGLDGWDRSMACLDATVTELETDGWLVNQTRMWMASDWAVRNGQHWRDGEDVFFTHLLDGSRAANRLGWQWVTGVGSAKHYGFSRWQVEKRAPSLCRECARRDACPIENWPDDPTFVGHEQAPASKRGPGADLVGPASVEVADDAEVVWLTAESLGASDPAMAANPELPVVFTFDAALLRRLQLSAKRLVFLTETLAEVAQRRPLELYLGDPAEALGSRRVAVTHAPVPGFAEVVRRVRAVETHPWPWLVRPSNGSVSSFSAWRKSVGAPR